MNFSLASSVGGLTEKYKRESYEPILIAWLVIFTTVSVQFDNSDNLN